MSKIINRFACLVLVVFACGNPVIALAKAVFNITPNILNISLTPTTASTLSYTVVNDTSHTINQLSVTPNYNSTGNASSITLQNDNCTPATLVPNASCTFQLLVSGANQPTLFALRPRVCGFNGLVCSVPLGGSAVQVSVPPIVPSNPSNPNAPTVTSVNPSSTSVPLTTAQITVNFSVAMNPATINTSNVQVVLHGTNTNILSGCTPNTGNLSFSCSLGSALTTNAQYDITISSAVKSATGLPLNQNFNTFFLTSALVAGDGTTNTYYVTSTNQLTQSSSGGNFALSTFTGGTPTGTITLISGDGNGRMYFTTSTGQVWQNSAGGAFSVATITGSPTGTISALGGDGTGGSVYFATSTNQLWGNTAGSAFTLQSVTGTVTGSISQIAGDGVQYACFLTTTNQVFCGFFNAWSQISYSTGALSGNIIRLVGVTNANTPIHICFFTTSNQLFEQNTPGQVQFSLATYTSGQPTGIVQQMASDGNGKLFFATTTNQVWGDTGGGAFSLTPVTGGTISGTVNGMSGINGFTYLTTTANQLFQNSGTSFSPITVGYTGLISQFSGSGGYMYFITLTNQSWQNLNGSAFTQVTHP